MVYLVEYSFWWGIICKLKDLYKNHKIKVDSKFELSIIEDDIFLEEIKGLSNEEKALKQLSKKQADIEKYLTLNLAHTKIIFAIGVFIIFIGIGIIASTIISIFLNENSVQLIVIVSGFLGGLLVDAVGAVFILMYTKTVESANKFQSNMVETANTYLGNVLVSQIANNELREQTLSIMARELVQADRVLDN
ncbi:hypothetical protein C0033_07150 [Clostridium sp. chh4-2]|uniref:hypothetical protein n=1 Tax=Clostridium sp. chh4-2 TaxID=2067550 RepID=UPI000CCE8A04|nr:hypothetical protein [Clostridium sp. chh4-2]PNV62793.1 hypothetical protein C0033_07150 [Clostridium sp. chh4-2]